MTTTQVVDDASEYSQEKPGARLTAVRLQKGYSIEYVAGKLHLRVCIIELLEADQYDKMPEPVFIKGYLRAYAKLLGVPVDNLIARFEALYSVEHKAERMLWQSKRETYRGENAIRWVTGLFALGVLIAVAMWWQKNKDSEKLFPTQVSSRASVSNKSETEIRLTDLSKMRSLLSASPEQSSLEADSE